MFLLLFTCACTFIMEKTNNIPTSIFTSTSNNFHYNIHEYSLKGKKESVRQLQNCTLKERDRNVFFLF